MLERKRLLRIKEQVTRDGRRVFIYEHPQTGDVFTIIDPDLKLDQLEQVQRDVGTLLEHGLTPPSPESPLPATEHVPPDNPPAPAAEPAVPGGPTGVQTS
jgi:hypothetical protein